MATANRKVCVRDVSWHTQVRQLSILRVTRQIHLTRQQPVLMSAGWLGSGWGANESSVIARHEWKGLSKMQYNLVDYTAKQAAERNERHNRRAGLRANGARMPGYYMEEEDDWF